LILKPTRDLPPAPFAANVLTRAHTEAREAAPKAAARPARSGTVPRPLGSRPPPTPAGHAPLTDKNWMVVDNSDAPGHHLRRIYLV
jgi:hypothetical protein